MSPKSPTPTTAHLLTEFSLPWQSQLDHWLGVAQIDELSFRQLNRPLLGIVSSHLGQNHFASARWQAALFSALSFAKQQGAAILYSGASPYAAAIQNACRKTNQIAFRIALSSSRIIEVEHQKQDHTVILTITSETDSEDMQSLPYLDRVIFALSQQLFVLDIEPKGKIANLVDRRLSSPHFPNGSIFLVQSPRSDSLRKRRWILSQLDRGAVGWVVSQKEPMAAPKACQRCLPWSIAPILPLRILKESKEKFLIHCTRARQGAWPDQSSSQFYDELIISPWSAPPSAFESLIRILENKRLIASSNLKHGHTPTVSFTERTLSELIATRTFETHLARWDWEPYGLMIDRIWLTHAGCRPVKYYTKEEMEQIPTDDRPFAQPYVDASSNEKKGRDWRIEREWRLMHDLRLHQIPFSMAIVFVKYKWEAIHLAPLSQWPICFTSTDT